MGYANEDIIAALRVRREARGLSQRELAAKVGLPQSHISRIESGRVDLKLSSLIEIARALDLELLLIPQSRSAAIASLLGDEARQRPVYSLAEEEDDG